MPVTDRRTNSAFAAGNPARQGANLLRQGEWGMESPALLPKPASPQKGSDHLRPFTPRVRHPRAQLVASGLRHAIPWNFSDVSLLASDGGSSACNLSSGEYTIRSNDNTCCTKDCTQQHEATHVKDITGWGCCKRASAAYTQSASPGKVAEMYNTWLERARALTECHAYT